MKNCPKCNAELPDDAVFCNNCGNNLEAPAEEATTVETSTPEAPTDNATLNEAVEKNKNTKIGMTAIIAAAAAVVLIIIIVICASAASGSYKTPIKTLVRNANHQNTKVESYLECVLPPFAMDTYNDVMKLATKVAPDEMEDAKEDMADALQDTFDDLCDEYGDDYKITIEFRDAEKLKDRDIRDLEDTYEELYDMLDKYVDFSDDDIYDDLADELEDEYDIKIDSKDIDRLQKIMETFMKNLKNAKIQAAYEVELKLRIEGDDGHDSQSLTVYVVKMNGKWVIDPLSGMSALGMGSIYNLMWYLY